MKEQDTSLRKSLPLSITTAGMVLVPALLFSLKSDLPHVFAICALILGYSVLKRKAILLGDRPIIYFLVIAASLATFMDMAIPMNDARTGILDILIKSSLSAPALLYLAAFSTLFAQKPGSIGVIATLSVAVMIVGGDVFRGANLTPERIFFAKPLTDNFSVTYMSCVAVELLFLVASLRLLNSHREAEIQRRPLLIRNTLRALCLAILPILAVAGTLAFYANEKAIRKLEQFLSTTEFLKRIQVESLPFPGEADINKGISKEDPRKAARIIARVKAKAAPGLLRAKSYTSYSGGCWKNLEANFSSLHGQRESETLTSTVFTISEKHSLHLRKEQHLEIFQSSAFNSELLLMPANANAVELIADKLASTQDGLFEPTNWKPEAGFTAFADTIDQNAAYQTPLSPETTQDYLEYPQSLKAVLEEIAKAAYPLAEKGHLSGDAALTAAVASTLRNRCQYSLETKDTPPGIDPVANFLTNTKKGHCELFASAATLTLRHMGIPARYVTGVVCDETHPSGAYYVARMGGTHAWCEAYLKDQGAWILVEATPASAFEQTKPAWGLFEAFADWIAQSFRQSFAWLQRGYFAEAIIEMAGDAVLFIWMLASSKLGMLVEALVALGALGLWVRGRIVALNQRRKCPQTMRKLQDEFKKLEKKASAASGIWRNDSMTLEEWALLAKQQCGEALPELVKTYESLRFRESPPSQSKVEEFTKEAMSLLKAIRH